MEQQTNSAEEEIKINVIPLNMDMKSVTCSFFEDKLKNSYSVPLQHHEMPASLKSQYHSTLYTDFQVHDEATATYQVDLKPDHHFSRHYLNFKVYEWFKERARLTGRNFVNQSEFYFRTDEGLGDKIASFDKFTIKGDIGRISSGAELTITYNGVRRVLLNSVYSYRWDKNDIKSVAYKGQVFSYKPLLYSHRKLNRDELYPVLNPDIIRRLNDSRLYKKVKNKTKRHSDKLDWFYKTFIEDDDFKALFKPIGSSYYCFKSNDVFRIDPEAADLEFGNEVISKYPKEGMLKGGLYEPPAGHIKFLIFAGQKDLKLAARLKNMMVEGNGVFPGFNAYTKTAATFSDKILTYKNIFSAPGEIQRFLNRAPLDENVQYAAICLIPFNKNNTDVKFKKIYHQLKDVFAQNNMASQFVYNRNITKSVFQFHLQNIAVSLAAKLNGIPWRTKFSGKNELVIGISAYKREEFLKSYVGSAYCFAGNGDFIGLNCYEEGDHEMLAGSLQQAVMDFLNQHDKVDRIIIHFYKEMKKQEADVIKRALAKMNIDVPVIILTIFKSGSTNFLLMDSSAEHRLPLSGTYVRCGATQYLLSNNTRYAQNDSELNAYPFPLKVQFDVAGADYKELEDYLNSEEWVYPLMEQVYKFSRLNWRNLKLVNEPVTLTYSELIAKAFPYLNGDNLHHYHRSNLSLL